MNDTLTKHFDEHPLKHPPAHAVIVGASGAVGQALARQCLVWGAKVTALCRSGKCEIAGARQLSLDLTDESSIRAAASAVAEDDEPDLVIVATGLLHDGDQQPEKSLQQLDAEKLARSFAINSIGPALVAKHFLPLLPRQNRGVFAALSARVGSIGDNRLGGWYGYRCSKAALNMLLKTTALEMQRSHRQALVVGLHPGTVDSNLSRPFQGKVPPEKLFTADFSAARLLQVLDGLTPQDSGQVFAWDGRVVPW